MTKNAASMRTSAPNAPASRKPDVPIPSASSVGGTGFAVASSRFATSIGAESTSPSSFWYLRIL